MINLTEHEKEILRESLRRFQQRNDAMAEHFYSNLFRIAPETRPLFGSDIIGQTQKTMLSLSAIISLMDDGPACQSMIEDLAIRHIGYGVVPEYYEKVGQALIATIRNVFGEDFPPDFYEAWKVAFARMSAIMIEAAAAELEARFA